MRYYIDVNGNEVADTSTRRAVPIPPRTFSTKAADLKTAAETPLQFQQSTWMRRIVITFTSREAIPEDQQKSWSTILNQSEAFLKGKERSADPNSGLRVVIDTAYPESDINLRVSGTKKLSLTQDNGVIELNNIAWETLVLIQDLKLFRVKIEAGYRNNDTLLKIFEGEIAYISQKITSRRDSTIYITYASEFVASWSQSRINFSVRSGINLYAMFNYLMSDGNPTRRVTLSDELKNIALEHIVDEYSTRGTIIENALKSNTGSWLSSASSLDNTIINISSLRDKRVIPIQSDMINIANGNPTVTSQGLNISLFPVFGLSPGDIIKVDQAMLDTSQGTESVSGVQSTFNTNFMDPNGCYIIKQLDYVLENRGQTFIFKIQAQSVSIFQGLIGG